MQEPKKIRGHRTVEKDKRYKNTWKIRFNTDEKNEKGRYIRSPKRTIHGSKAADEEGGAYAIEPMLIAATGVRKSEMLGLTWKYVDFENDQFFVAFQRGVDKQLRPPKTKLSRRWLCVRGYMSEKLKTWKVEQAAYLATIGIEQTKDTPAFNDELGNFIDEANYGRWWRNFAVDNGFGKFTKDVRTTKMNGKLVTRCKGYKGYTLHELRHTQATLLQGIVSPKAAQHR